jgi:hypothetical protein
MRLAFLLVIVAALSGCVSRLDPRDPEIWRPSPSTSYPLPE